MSTKHNHSHFIPSPFPAVTQYEDKFIEEWKKNTQEAVAGVLRYIAQVTASAIKTKELDIDETSLKSFIDIDLEKGHNVGDIIDYNGKSYIYTEYQPGKYDWHVLKNKSDVMKGIGFRGKHGASALKEIYSTIDNKFVDVSKMFLKRTPKGNWRLYYDDVDTGQAIEGNVITESELKNDNVLYQRRKVVDNFDMVKKYMTFDTPNDVYFVQVIKRWKDKPGADQWKASGKAKGSYHSGAEYLDYYLIHSEKELEDVRKEIIKSANNSNARAYISINSRDEKQSNDYIKKFKARFTDHNDPRYKNAEPIIYGMAKSGEAWKDVRLKVLLDIDTTRDSEVTINGKKKNVWDEVRDRLQKYNVKIAAEYETPSGGLHLILNNKNNRNLKDFFKGLKDFDGGRDLGKLAMVHPSEDIKMVLYSNVDTEGY